MHGSVMRLQYPFVSTQSKIERFTLRNSANALEKALINYKNTTQKREELKNKA